MEVYQGRWWQLVEWGQPKLSTTAMSATSNSTLGCSKPEPLLCLVQPSLGSEFRGG